MEEQRTPGKSKRRASFTIADATVRAGRGHRFEIPFARIPTGLWLSLPVAVLHGARPGPTIWLSGALHGDELNGVPIIREIIERTNPKTLAGTLIAVPIINVFGLITGSRYLPDRRDLNRSFPGSPRGSLAAQLADLFMTQVVRRCEFGIDFHTGSNGRTNLPQIRCNLDDPEVSRLASEFGAPVILHSLLRRGSLREAAAAAGIKMLLYEAGEAMRFHRGAINAGVAGTMRVMRHLGMIDEEVPPPANAPVFSRRSLWVRARRGGLCRMRASLGDYVEENQKIAVVLDSIGKTDATVRARNSGVLIGHISQAVVNRGDAVAHIAEVDKPAR